MVAALGVRTGAHPVPIGPIGPTVALVAPIGTLELVASFVGWTAEGHAEVKTNEVPAHLD